MQTLPVTESAEAEDGQLRVSFLPLSVAGRIGFTLMPGRRGRDAEGRMWTRDLEEDVDRLVRVVGVESLVLLVSDSELSAGRAGELSTLAERRGLEVVSAPLARLPRTLPSALLDGIVRRAEAGRTVVLVSADGQGRAPYVAARLLIAQGTAPERALRVLRRLAPSCLTEPAWMDALGLSSAPATRVADPVEARADERFDDEPSRPRWLDGLDEEVEPVEGALAAPSEERPLRTVAAPRAAMLYRSASSSTSTEPASSEAPLDPPWTREDTLFVDGPPPREPLESAPPIRTEPPAPSPAPQVSDLVEREPLRAASYGPLESAFVGALVGAALGDAFGAPLERIEDPERLETATRARALPELAVPPGGRSPVALLSDETQQLELAIETLIEVGRRRLELDVTLERLAERLGRWSTHPRGGHRNPEGGSVELARRLSEGTPWPEVGSNALAGAHGLLRAVPFGLSFSNDPRRAEHWAAAQSRITHRNERSVAAAAALAATLAALTRGEPLTFSLSEGVAAACRYDPSAAARLALALRDADAGVPPSRALEQRRERNTLEVLESAFYVVRRVPDDLEGAVRIAAATPGDSDAVAALTGALIGARLGAGALPQAWVGVLERAEGLEALALALAASRG